MRGKYSIGKTAGLKVCVLGLEVIGYSSLSISASDKVQPPGQHSATAPHKFPDLPLRFPIYAKTAGTAQLRRRRCHPRGWGPRRLQGRRPTANSHWIAPGEILACGR